MPSESSPVRRWVGDGSRPAPSVTEIAADIHRANAAAIGSSDSRFTGNVTVEKTNDGTLATADFDGNIAWSPAIADQLYALYANLDGPIRDASATVTALENAIHENWHTLGSGSGGGLNMNQYGQRWNRLAEESLTQLGAEMFRSAVVERLSLPEAAKRELLAAHAPSLPYLGITRAAREVVAACSGDAEAFSSAVVRLGHAGPADKLAITADLLIDHRVPGRQIPDRDGLSAHTKRLIGAVFDRAGDDEALMFASPSVARHAADAITGVADFVDAWAETAPGEHGERQRRGLVNVLAVVMHDHAKTQVRAVTHRAAVAADHPGDADYDHAPINAQGYSMLKLAYGMECQTTPALVGDPLVDRARNRLAVAFGDPPSSLADRARRAEQRAARQASGQGSVPALRPPSGQSRTAGRLRPGSASGRNQGGLGR